MIYCHRPGDHFDLLFGHKSPRLPHMQSHHTGLSGNLQLSRFSDTEAGQPAAADNQLVTGKSERVKLSARDVQLWD